MVLGYYFLIAQLIVFISYFIFKRKDWSKRETLLFDNKFLYAIVIANSIFFGVNYNLNYPLFCNPVTWTYWILFPVAGWLTFFPILKEHESLRAFNSIFMGISLFVIFYILMFGGLSYLFLAFGVSLLGIPIYLISKKVTERFGKHNFDWINFYWITFLWPLYLFILLIKQLKYFHKYLVAAPVILIITISIYTTIKINSIEHTFVNDTNYKEQFIELKKNPVDEYFLELFLGLHWKYHTRLILVDGWRPPYHDPIVGVRRWLNLGDYIINYTYFQDLQEEYKEIFPEKNIKFPCKCAKIMF